MLGFFQESIDQYIAAAFTLKLTDMFGGYSEVAAYYVSEPELSDEREECTIEIPPEYLPSHCIPDPWHQNSICHDDFILIAEFCEQEGPKPLVSDFF